MKNISTNTAPSAIGPYSQAVVHEKIVYCTGQIALDPETMEIISGGVAEQTEQVLKNLGEVLKASGSSFERALKVTVFLKDINDFATMNEIYAKYFTNKPARAAVQAARLPKDVLVEIDCIAYID